MTNPDTSSRPVLGEREVHVWRFTLDPSDERIARCETTLSADEGRRAARFRGPGLRRRYVAGRGGLRSLLACYTRARPETLAFSYGAHGKPSLVEAPPRFEFNLSHSHGLALCAVSTVGTLGVDLEQIRPMEEDGRKLIGRFFSAVEQVEFLGLAEGERLGAFFRGWTRKEAFLKAVGTGLATVLDSFDVTLGPSVAAALLRFENDPAAAARWSLHDIDLGLGFAAALAVESRGTPIDVVVRDFAPESRAGMTPAGLSEK